MPDRLDGGNSMLLRNGNDPREGNCGLRLTATGVLLCLASFLTLCGSSDAQSPDTVQVLRQMGLPSLAGDVPAYYSPCCKDRAVELQSAIEGSLHFYDQNLGVRVGMNAAVLTKEDWERAMQKVPKDDNMPFGLAGVTDSLPRVAFLPATDDNTITQSYLSRQDQAGSATLSLLQSAHISYQEAAREFVVHVGLHEIGHLQEVEYGIAAPNKWFNEMLASYFSYAYLKARQPPVATVVEALDQIPLKPMPHTSLEDFEKLYLDVGMENYVWYQQQFERRAIKVYAEQGLEFLKKVKSAFPAAGNSPLETKKDELTPTALILRLERICPGFQAWASELQSMSSPSKP
jgi:hypothetical protein